MLLSRITVNPDRFQKRQSLWSTDTVDGILKEGLKPSKFDPIPIIPVVASETGPGALWCVAGDGHSRYEAARQLADRSRLPRPWWREGDWEIPTKEIYDEAEADLLAWTANFSKKTFTPTEEAKVFQEMLDAGNDIEEVARLTHTHAAYVRQMLPLNYLCADIRLMVGRPAEAGGIEKFIAQELATKFKQYEIDAAAQQNLWHSVLKHADLTAAFVRKLIDRIGSKLTEKTQEQGFLFAVPPAAETIVKAMKGRADNQRRLERGLAWLLQANREAPSLVAEFKGLKDLLDRHGAEMLERAKSLCDHDADLVGAVVTNDVATLRRVAGAAA